MNENLIFTFQYLEDQQNNCFQPGQEFQALQFAVSFIVALTSPETLLTRQSQPGIPDLSLFISHSKLLPEFVISCSYRTGYMRL